MKKKKLHPLVMTVAICQVVFGVLGLGCAGWGVLDATGLYMLQSSPNRPPVAPVPPNNAPKGQPVQAGDAFGRGYAAGMEAQLTVLQKVPSYAHVQMVSAIFGLFLSVLMIAGGTGLFFMHSWARWLTIGYGLLSLFSRCVYVGYFTAVVLPIIREVGAAYIAAGNPDMDTSLWGLKSGPFIGLLLALYPILVIVLLLVPPVNKAFKRRPVREEPEEDYDDRDDRDDRDDERPRPRRGEGGDRFRS